MSKRKSAKALLEDFHVNRAPPTRNNKFYIALTRPNIELIWCDDYIGQDAYTYPILKEIIDNSDWAKDNKFAASYSFRESRESNTLLFNVTPAKNNTLYPRRYFIRFVDENESTKQSRYQILEKCVNFMNENQNNNASSQKTNSASPQRVNQKLYTIPEDYDRTPTTLLSLDHYLLNKDVYSLIQKIFINGVDWSDWASNNSVDAPCYFSPPYCKEARDLGYK